MKQKVKTPKQEAVKEVVEDVEPKEIEHVQTVETTEPVIRLSELGGPQPTLSGNAARLKLPPEILKASNIRPSSRVLVECSQPGEILIRKFEPDKMGVVEQEQLKKRLT